MTLSNIVVYWRFENTDKSTLVKLTDQLGVGTNVYFGQGYWSFEDIRAKLSEEGVTEC